MNLEDVHCTMNYDPQISSGALSGMSTLMVDTPDSLKPVHMLEDISNPHVSMWVNTLLEQKDLGPMVRRIRSEPDHQAPFNQQGELPQPRETQRDVTFAIHYCE